MKNEKVIIVAYNDVIKYIESTPRKPNHITIRDIRIGQKPLPVGNSSQITI